MEQAKCGVCGGAWQQPGLRRVGNQLVCAKAACAALMARLDKQRPPGGIIDKGARAATPAPTPADSPGPFDPFASLRGPAVPVPLERKAGFDPHASLRR